MRRYGVVHPRHLRIVDVRHAVVLEQRRVAHEDHLGVFRTLFDLGEGLLHSRQYVFVEDARDFRVHRLARVDVSIRARNARDDACLDDVGEPGVVSTGNHEYYTEAQGWVDLMDELGWEPLRNRHLLLERGGDSLVVAGVDDVTAESSGLAGHRAHLAGALRGADPELPVLLLAHQPAFVDRAAAEGVDLQISGHTHGGQIWPFHYLVRLDQPALAGLSHHGARTLLYTSRGTGFWGPPFRVFAPSEITLLVLRSSRQPASS
ncbi:metallophosphoesterase [Streptomyces sp. NPDC053728]|uniref:metallophosphoesterase n=1 Tax=Streptomyces sp. NPDC053728 TaxID=3155534 RepID=UPI003413071F